MLFFLIKMSFTFSCSSLFFAYSLALPNSARGRRPKTALPWCWHLDIGCSTLQHPRQNTIMHELLRLWYFAIATKNKDRWDSGAPNDVSFYNKKEENYHGLSIFSLCWFAEQLSESGCTVSTGEGTVWLARGHTEDNSPSCMGSCSK